ncbi:MULTISPECIES: ribosome hibernation-promoting factor, HPF/YfiA family [Acidithiobacillus]|jgi:putative sigma-54 modulation protein|uniref:Ribosome hibernation promoting factor n=2 Tax=Acidithiobacillus caldus TaxID=33059 RepID=A0A059ZRM4_ACICK|nr:MULTISPECIES: ribosome-associated translation inhibitor RaiA [Acidithiobacillus]AIA54290.1 Ribosome hibernation protein YhbH [Acidithiobacillus caldus ATCC 51756]MBU2730199.1 ribosome-associated translation inhibitor RaiA [Acidithiobacillus caldus]MBU2734662.1 ribosome-associated translation inhibitor RaiA [Acidithiobacillus caldus ATCC 51756]MBU2744359.1 ribosome-associated translation inhibitor RaiA [Acidithiobacillus caldus]MBU2763147.1 ribosome-associated translation inhibitor RaiA [Aci
MQISITGQHLDLTEALKSYVSEKISRLDRYFDHVLDARVVLKHQSHEKLPNIVEITVHSPGHDFHADCHDADMYAAIDLVAAKLEGQVRQYKERLRDHRTEPSGAVSVALQTD